MTNTSVSITIGHTTQIHVLDKDRREYQVNKKDMSKTRIEWCTDRLEHNQCNSEVTVNGQHLCGKRILKNCY